MGKVREFWGFDLETSGTSHESHVPIQVGIAAPNGEGFDSLVGGWDWEAWHWDDQAFEVHGITKERLEDAPSRFQVQVDGAEFINNNTRAWIGERLVVGWNVASFDMPYVRQYLPAISNSLSYRSVDLNAVCFGISEALKTSYGDLKMASKEFARQTLEKEGHQEQWHDALYDARAALRSFEYLQWTIREGV